MSSTPLGAATVRVADAADKGLERDALGLGRIVAFIGRNFGPERETARVRLLELFDVVGTGDDRVAKARQNLARVLF